MGHEKWLKLVHLQDESLRRHTLSVGIGDDPVRMYSELIRRATPGTTVVGEDLSNLKKFSSWNTRFSGVGKIRGHSVTYSTYFGVQVWVFLEVDLDVGQRNITALIGESKTEVIKDVDDLESLWEGSLQGAREDWCFGSIWPVEYDKRMKKHVVVDRSIQATTPEPPVGSESSAVVQACTTG